MNEAVFSLASLVAIAAWLGLAVACVLRASATRRKLLFVCGRAVPIGLCGLYAALLVHFWGTTPGGGFASLATVLTLFSAPGKMLGGWIHFLAFDLLVGRWMVDDSLAKNRSRLPLLPALPATFMYGPLGVLLYLAGRVWAARIDATAPP